MSKGAKKERSEEPRPPSAVMERLNWQLAWRDDARVAQALYAGEEIEEMHELSEAGLLDEFFVFLEEMALMEVVGFNARQVEEGLTHRGDALRKTRKKQGPLSPQSLADNISKLSHEQMEGFFNQMVRCVVALGLLDGERMAALDGSKLPTPPTYEGCGKLKQTRKVKVKGQKERAIEEYYVYGWKVLVLMDVHTRLPLAMHVVKIEEYEGRWLLPLLEQAQRNLGTRGHISTIVIDRGYLDGEDLWLVDQQGVIFVIVSKANMAVTQDAQAL